MAFENVFGNVDFGLPVRSANADRQYFAQMLGQQIQKQQFEQEMDMRKRQMENKDPNIKTLAENALLKRNMGMPTTPQEDAAIQVMGQTQRPQIYTDPLTQQTVVRPSPWGSLIEDLSVKTPLPRGAEPTVPDFQGMSVPQDSPGMSLPGAGTQAQYTDDVGVIGGFEAPPELGARGQIMEAESAQKSSDYLSKKQIDSIFESAELNKAALNEQKSYEQEVGKLIDGYLELHKAGATIETLPEDYTLLDVAKNIKSSLMATDPGKAVTGAIGTKGKAAIDQIDATRPIMFGKLRTLLGMTGKELDTKKERDFYLKALTSPETDVETNFKILRNLSARFGTGDNVEKIDSVLESFSKEKDVKGMSQEEKLERYRYLKNKMGAQ